MFPLFFQMGQQDMAAKAAVVLETEFLKPGGLVTSLVDTDQQWDAPNGWAPLTMDGVQRIEKLSDGQTCG
jgi:alpha,alpha-trehalase